MKDIVIITAALADGQPLKEHNPSVPYTPDEFAREGRRAEEAGAAIAHTHFREPDTGTPTADPKYMVPIYQTLKENTDAINSCIHAIPPGATWQGIGVGSSLFSSGHGFSDLRRTHSGGTGRQRLY